MTGAQGRNPMNEGRIHETADETADNIISADDHMDLNVLPPKLWEERLPGALRSRAPRVVETPEGAFWQVDGQRVGASGRKNADAKDTHKLGFRPGNPQSRLQDMDRDGIRASVIYGPPGGIRFPDREVSDACLVAYNDWALEFNAAAPDRLLALALLPSHGPDVAKAELLRAARAGHRGVVLELHESADKAFYEPWEAFWAAANDAGIPVHFHLAGGMHSLQGRPKSWRIPAVTTVIPMQLDEAIVGMIFSGLLERYPRLKIVMGESGLGWLPYLLARMDLEYRNYFDITLDYRLKEPPSFYWRRQMFVTYEEDDFGLEHLDRIGAGNVMWASDFPHGDTTWPHSRRHIMESTLGKLDAASRRAVIHDNAARVYGLG
jgi:predicted TIM-barrel fold metal-dependent hydrolase